MVTPIANDSSPPHSPRRPGGKALYWAIATGLAAILAATLATELSGAWKGLETSAWQQRIDRPVHFLCERCGHRFSMVPGKFREQWLDVDPTALPPESRHKAHCPQCKGRYCASRLGR